MREELDPRTAFERNAVVRFRAVMDDFVDVLGNIAVTAAIDVHGRGRIRFAAGHAGLACGDAASPDHLFQIGSQTKTLIAMTMLRLDRLGKLDLDAAVKRYLDLPIDERITLRHLLMNTCGLGDKYLAIPWSRLDPRLAPSPRDIVALVLPQGQLFEPGERFDYCNVGWVIAAMTLEAVMGMSHGAAIKEVLLEPLGLIDTQVGGEAPVGRMLRGYVASAATQGRVDTAGCLDWLYGSGDGVSSLDDMLDLFGSLASGTSPVGISLDDLAAVTAKPSEEPYFPLSIGTEYGLGVERRAWAGSEVWGHPGSTLAYLTGTWLDAKLGVTVTTCVTRLVDVGDGVGSDLRYPRAQLFAMALSTAYALAPDAGTD